MSELPRVSPLLPPAGGSPVQVARAIKTLEELPKIPTLASAPTSSTNGYEGQHGLHGGKLYAYLGGAWYSATLSVVP